VKDMKTSVVLIFEYFGGLFFFGLAYWILNGILPELSVYSLTGSVYDLANYIWAAAVVIYLLFGIWYLIIKIKTWKFFYQV